VSPVEDDRQLTQELSLQLKPLCTMTNVAKTKAELTMEI
jgi:hypothetical protein